jgi:hypothetical protein
MFTMDPATAGAISERMRAAALSGLVEMPRLFSHLSEPVREVAEPRE